MACSGMLGYYDGLLQSRVVSTAQNCPEVYVGVDAYNVRCKALTTRSGWRLNKVLKGLYRLSRQF